MATTSSSSQQSIGNDRILLGMILGLLAFWLFAQTTLNVAPAMKNTLGIETTTMNIGVSITGLFSGIFIVIFGGLADHFGRLKLTQIGFLLSILGTLLVAMTPANSAWTVPTLLTGRAFQGLSAACIMPATLSLVKIYWEGPAQQRAISLWTLGTAGGSSLCSFVGGLMQIHFGWRSIFWMACLLSIVGLLLMKGAPESKVEHKGRFSLDLNGIFTFMVTMIALQVLITQGSRLGWTSISAFVLLAVTLVFGILFFVHECRFSEPFFDFKLFKNKIFTGAVISNFLVNTAVGVLIVSLQLLQLAGHLTAWDTGLLTLGFAFAVIIFIRLGEKLVKHLGLRLPMMWGALILAISVALLALTHLDRHDYIVLAGIAYTLFGLGLILYATPSVAAALSNLPENQAGSGSGIYKMTSSLGGAFGVAISASIFTAIRLSHGLDFSFASSWGQNTDAIRQAAMIALSVNFCLVMLAVLVIIITIPKAKTQHN